MTASALYAVNSTHPPTQYSQENNWHFINYKLLLASKWPRSPYRCFPQCWALNSIVIPAGMSEKALKQVTLQSDYWTS